MQHPRRFLITLISILTIVPGLACRSDSTTGDPVGDMEVVEDTASIDTVAGKPVAGDIILPDTVNDERSVAERLRDVSTATKIRVALVNHDSLRTYDFAPEVYRGMVVLHGEVQVPRERNLAEQIAEEVGGVRRIDNRIVAIDTSQFVNPPTSRAPSGTPAQSTVPASQSTPSAQSITPSQSNTSSAQTASAPEQSSTNPPATTPQKPSENYHTVKSGESLWSISQQYGITVAQLEKLNAGKTRNLLPGQRLRVK